MRYSWSCILILALAAGCRQPATLAPVTTTRPATWPATAPADRPVMAYVQGAPVYMDQLCDILVEAYGMPVAQQLVATELVEQQARQEGIAQPAEQEVQEESDRTMTELFPQVANPAQREQLLAQMLQQRGMLPRQWRMVMHRNVLLRKMAVKTVTVGEEDLRKEYDQEYDRQVQVRHIELPTLQAAQDVLRRLREGADSTQLAIELSTSDTSEEGGLLPPIGPQSPVAPAVRQAALAMTEVGQVSEPVQSGTVFHILKLDKIIPPRSVPFEQVRDQLHQRLMQERIRGEQRRIIETLIDQARQEQKIQFVHPAMAEQYQRAEE